MFYIDNNSSRDVAISGRARTQPGSDLVAELLKLEDESCTNSWFARVPSASNIADGPSRNCMSEISVRPVSRELVYLAVKKILQPLCTPDKKGDDAFSGGNVDV